MPRHRRIALLGALLLVPLSPRAAPLPVAPGPVARTAGEPTECLLAWGSGAGQVGLRRAGSEALGEGAWAAAVGPQGDVWVLDRLNGRALRLEGGALVPVASRPVPRDAEDLAVSADGEVLAVYSALRARVWLHDRDGEAGEVAVPRALRLVTGFELGRSRQLLFHTAHQETFRLGGPGVPQADAAVLAGKREGAAFLPDGTGLQVVRREDGRPELVLVAPGAERTQALTRRVIERAVLAARIVGVTGETACLRLEQEEIGPVFRVRRELLCLDARTGALRLSRGLPLPGPYTPRRELAVGAGRVVFLHPEEAGLRVVAWDLPEAGR